jgi:hypothetical protein
LCYLQGGKLKNILEEKSMASVIQGGRDLWERIFPPFAFNQESEPVKEGQSGGCQRDGGSSGGCSSSMQEPAPALISAETTKEAVELSLKAFAGQLESRFAPVDFLTERILELVTPNVSPGVISEVIGAYLKCGDWRPAMAVANKAGRELTGGEIQNGFAVLAEYGNLRGFIDLANTAKTRAQTKHYVRLIYQLSFFCSSDIEWAQLVQVLDAAAPQEAIDLAVILCARYSEKGEKERLAGLEIIAGHAVSGNARHVFLGAIIAAGLIRQSQMAAQKIFGRELTTDEFCQATTAALQIAEKKRRQTQESYEAED